MIERHLPGDIAKASFATKRGTTSGASKRWAVPLPARSGAPAKDASIQRSCLPNPDGTDGLGCVEGRPKPAKVWHVPCKPQNPNTRLL